MATQITTGKVRFSYCNLFTPRAAQEGATPKYSVTLLIPKSDKATLQKIKAAMDEAKSKFMANHSGKKLPTNLKNAEIDEIAKISPDISLNLSSGGINDASFGGKIFWERMNANPEEREEYLKKLSDRKKADDWSDYAALTQRSLAWRKEHPKEAYKNSYRAIRIANKAQSRNTASKPELSLKERLRRKHKLNDVKSEYVSQAWGNRSAEERKAISEKISQTLKARMAELSDSERQSITEKARASIDRKKQGAAASAGLKRFWEELRRNPKQYREYIDRRRESLKSKLKERCNENV